MRNRLSTLVSAGVVLGVAGAALADDIKVSAGLEYNYSYNFNKPGSRSNTFLFNGRDSDFSINRTEFSISKAPSASGKAGFHVCYIDGQAGDVLKALTGGTSNFAEAYGIVTGTFGDRDLSVEAGQFKSLFGVEKIQAGDFYSRSFSFQLLQPILGKGVRAALTLDEDTTLTGYIQNGLSNVDNSNKDLAFGVQYGRKLGEDSSVRVNLATGREPVVLNQPDLAQAGVNRSSSIANVVYTRAFGEDTSFALDGTIRFGRDASDNDTDTTGIAAYLTRKLGNGGAFAVRGEYLSQSSATAGLLPSGAGNVKPNLTSITFAYHLPGGSDASRTIIEYRYDRSNGFVFEKEANSLKKDQGTLTIGQVFRF
ncbi:MAG: outer membrane beta-barrel protein [Armatimonadota bacterium]